MNDDREITDLLQKLLGLYTEGDYESIRKILKAYNNLDNPVNRYYKEDTSEMIFCYDVILDVRVAIDEETKQIIDSLTMIAHEGYTLSEIDLIQLITNNWIKSAPLMNVSEISKFTIDNNSKRQVHIKITEMCWNNFVKLCKKKGIKVEHGFKSAVYCFMDTLLDVYNDM